VRRVVAPLSYAASAALHAALLLVLVRLPPPARGETVSVEVIETSPPPPPPARPAAEEPPPPPRPQPRIALRERRRPEVAPPPREAPPAPAPAPAPPPPNAPVPESAPPPSQAPVRIGVAMSGSTQGGTMPAPAGNTLYGEMPKTAPEPSDVRPYGAESYVPPTRARRLPRPVSCEIPRTEYPQAAAAAGIEGKVRLRILVGEDGRVLEAQVLEEPGHGLGAAAAAGVKRHCRFEPGEGDAGPAATWIPYTVRWELE
jgi:protein TonB